MRRALVSGRGLRLVIQGLHGVLYTTWRFRLHARRRTARNNLAPNPAFRMPLPAASSRHRLRQARVAAAHFKRAIWREKFHVKVPILNGMAAKRKEAAPEVVIEATARFYRATVCPLPSTAYARGAPRFGERALLTPGRGAHRNITCLCGGSRTGDAKSIGTTLRSSTTRWRCATATSSRASRFRPTAPGATIPKRRRSKSTAKTSRRCWSDISTHECATSVVHTRTCMHRGTHACARALMCNAALLSGVRFSPAPPHPSPPCETGPQADDQLCCGHAGKTAATSTTFALGFGITTLRRLPPT